MTQPAVVSLRQPLRGGRGARQQLEESFEALLVVAVRCGQLPEKRAGELAERQHAAGEEVGEGRLAASQLEVVGDEAAPLDGEEEAARHLRPPPREDRRRLERV